MDTDTPGASTSQSIALCCDGPTAYVAWTDYRDGLTDVYVNHSVDAGATWQATDIPRNTDAPGTALSRDVRICCDGAVLYAAWEDWRDGFPDIRFTVSQP